MAEVIKIIFPIFTLLVGIYAALGIWFPRFRGKWKGTQMTCGRLSCASFALFFLSMGVAILVFDSVAERHRIWLFFPVMIGWILGVAGYALDARAYARSSIAFLTLSSPQGSRRNEQQGWLFVAIGIIFSLMVVWIFVLHK